jgi:hypothetical protein
MKIDKCYCGNPNDRVIYSYPLCSGDTKTEICDISCINFAWFTIDYRNERYFCRKTLLTIDTFLNLIGKGMQI